MGIVRFLDLAFFDVLSQNRLKILEKSLGLRTLYVEIIRSPCDVREESLRFLTEPLRSPYDSRTMVGVRPSFVYYRTYTTSLCIMDPPKEKDKRSSQNYTDDEVEPGEKQAALNDRIVQFFEDRPYFYGISNEQ